MSLRVRNYIAFSFILILALSACVRVRSVPSAGSVVAQPDQVIIFSTLFTEVRFVHVSAASDEIPLYGGPGPQHGQIGVVAGGTGAHVIGVSADGQWWRILCDEDVSGDSCWISADPQITQPSISPGLLTNADGLGRSV